jgi:hypothetical protein
MYVILITVGLLIVVLLVCRGAAWVARRWPLLALLLSSPLFAAGYWAGHWSYHFLDLPIGAPEGGWALLGSAVFGLIFLLITVVLVPVALTLSVGALRSPARDLSTLVLLLPALLPTFLVGAHLAVEDRRARAQEEALRSGRPLQSSPSPQPSGITDSELRTWERQEGATWARRNRITDERDCLRAWKESPELLAGCIDYVHGG